MTTTADDEYAQEQAFDAAQSAIDRAAEALREACENWRQTYAQILGDDPAMVGGFDEAEQALGLVERFEGRTETCLSRG